MCLFAHDPFPNDGFPQLSSNLPWRPLLEAIQSGASDRPIVFLIDEIDRSNFLFSAMAGIEGTGSPSSLP